MLPAVCARGQPAASSDKDDHGWHGGRSRAELKRRVGKCKVRPRHLAHEVRPYRRLRCLALHNYIKGTRWQLQDFTHLGLVVISHSSSSGDGRIFARTRKHLEHGLNMMKQLRLSATRGTAGFGGRAGLQQRACNRARIAGANHVNAMVTSLAAPYEVAEAPAWRAPGSSIVLIERVRADRRGGGFARGLEKLEVVELKS